MFEKPAMQRAGLSSATSLALLSAISLDTETTGLVVAKARVIEIGACRLSDGNIVAGDDYAQLVDPQEPIPARSTAVHGIKDSDVAGQPHFRAAARRFAKWAGGATVIGYSIGFDLAILERECRRANLEWVAPRSLDVRHLVSALGPSLPDNALDTVAAWLGVEIAGRHRALGDAVATARVFRALVPRLAEHGIRTLAEAEAAARTARSAFPARSRRAGTKPCAPANWRGPRSANWPASTAIPTATGCATSCRRRRSPSVPRRRWPRC